VGFHILAFGDWPERIKADKFKVAPLAFTYAHSRALKYDEFSSPRPGDSMMNRRNARRVLICCALALLSACSRDPKTRKQKYFSSGEKYFGEARYHEAVIQYSNAVQIDPRFADAHAKLAQAYLKLGDSSHAFQELNRTVELAPNNYRAQIDLTNLLISVRNPDGSPVPDMLQQAKTHLDLLSKEQPDNAETHAAWANYYAAINDLATATQEMQHAIKLDPNRADSYLMLALLQQRSNAPDQAEASFKKAIEVDPKNLNAQLALGGFYQAHNRLPEAEQQFRRSIEIDPKVAAPRAVLVRLLMQQGKKDETESLLKQTKKDLPDNPESYRMLGDFYFALGDLDKALAEYTSLYSDHPKDTQVKKNYIQILILKNRLDEAARLNDEILKSSPHDADALVAKGELQIRQNNAPGAIESLQEALRNDSENAFAHYQLGVAFSQQNDSHRAEAEWREAVRIRPDLTDAQRALASLEIGRNDTEAVLQTAQQIIATQPYLPDGYILKAIAEVSRQKFTDAQHDAEQAQQIAPDSAAPYVQLGNIQFAQKHLAEAAKHYQEALEKDRSSTEALSGLMNSYMAGKQVDNAIAAANTQIAQVSNSTNFYDLLGTALLNGKKEYPGAEAAFRKAIELDSHNTDAVEKLGKTEIQKGAPDQALALYLQAAKDNPKEVRFNILAGEIYEAQQNWDQAKAMYQQALNVSPENPLASNNLAYVMLQHGGNVDVAMNLAQTARRAMPDNPSAADTLGWAYFHKGSYGDAIRQFQEALRLNQKSGAPDDAVVHYHLGLAYQKANQIALARQQMEKAVQLAPDNTDARKALSELHG
jgi:tetratricopeptide (TPR) repeat protein